MNGRAEMLFARSGLGGLGIKHQLATRGTTEKHGHCIRTLVGKMSVLRVTCGTALIWTLVFTF